MCTLGMILRHQFVDKDLPESQAEDSEGRKALKLAKFITHEKAITLKFNSRLCNAQEVTHIKFDGRITLNLG